MNRRYVVSCLLALLVLSGSAAGTLTIYFIDVEGGQSTLVVTPAGESLLIDAGFPSNGSFGSKPGDPATSRDPQRILAAAKDAGISRIDNLMITHFHADHMGGVPELAQLIPIRRFIDHGTVPADADHTVGGTLAAFDLYAATRAKGAQHLQPKAGDKLPLRDLDVTVVSAGGAVLGTPMAGAASGANAACGPMVAPQEPIENPRSTGIVLRFGKFRFLDIGDLIGEPLHALACPRDLIGPVDVYLVAHHGGADVADPATFAAFRPRVAIVNNGPAKGGAPETIASVNQSPGLEAAWQLHRAEPQGSLNLPDPQIANLDVRTSHWIKLRASEDGSFDVTNGRTGATRSFRAR